MNTDRTPKEKMSDNPQAAAGKKSRIDKFGSRCRHKQAKPSKLPLKKRLSQFMIFFWFLPIEILFLISFFTYRVSYIERTERMIRESVASSAILTSNRIDEAIRTMQKPSYERVWETSWRQNNIGIISRETFYVLIKNTLKKDFYSDDRFDSCAFYLKDTGNNAPLFFTSHDGQTMNEYLEKVQPEVEKIMEKDSNYVEVHIIDGQVYLIRNLYAILNYQKYGTLVVALDSAKLTDGFPMQIPANVLITVNGTEEIFKLGEPDKNPYAKELYGRMFECFAPDAAGKVITLKGSKYRGYMYEKKMDDYSLGLYYVVHDRMMNTNLNHNNWVVLLVSGTLLIITAYGIWFLKRNIEEPLDWMVEASRKIEKGKIGTTVQVEPMPNEEFSYLATSFNEMSEQVKYLFDTVYTEQIARKDAQIAALQAQINPHFLNNTLEMMNWQARMNNDIETCKMIESLSIVLDHSINRDNQKTIYLSEELRCADAYLYIMSMRFGQRLKVEREIDEELLRKKIPQLILQPLLENAIIHGIETVRQGRIWLKVHHNEKYMYVDVINTGKEITEEKAALIQKILNGTYQPKPEERGKHTSIGIRNVNRRIQLVYGEQYGLEISAMEDGRTLSRVTMPYEKDSVTV